MVKVMRRITEAAIVPQKEYGGFGEEPYGDGCGVQGEGRGRGIGCLIIRGYGYYLVGIVPLP
jgi:hypothetical protein